MTITQAAALLNKSDMTVRRWLKEGYIKAIKIGNTWEISSAEVERIKNGESFSIDDKIDNL